MNALKPSARRYYLPELDVVRFIAFFMVFLHHVLPLVPTPHLNSLLKEFASVLFDFAEACRFGLSLFFTLSAFLIFELLHRESETAGSVAVKQFYIRRILRIWPLYYFALILGALFTLTPGGARTDVIGIGWYVIFMGAWQAAMHGMLNNPMWVLWSISVEEQFYLFAPWIAKYFNRKSLYALCAGLFLFSSTWLYHLGAERASNDRIWADSIVQFQCFAAGILLSLILGGRLPQISVWKRILLFASGGLCWLLASYALQMRFDSQSLIGFSAIGRYALASLGSVIVIVSFLGLNPKLIPGWAMYLGRISFGLYVYHGLAITLVDEMFPPTISYHALMFLFRTGAAFGLTVLMAALSYRYFEVPFLKMKQRHSVIDSRPV